MPEEIEYVIKELALSSGAVPFRNWFSKPDKHTRARTSQRIDRIRAGNFEDLKKLGDEVFELRMHFGSGYPVYYARDGLHIIILLAGSTKRTQNKDIEKAKKLWK